MYRNEEAKNSDERMVVMYNYYVRTMEEYEGLMALSESITKSFKKAYHDWAEMNALMYQYA